MKIKNMISGLCLLGVLACGEDFSGYIYEPSQEVNRLFVETYPEAEVILWRNRGKYDEVFFSLAGNSCQAWYSKEGKWILTETEVEGQELPLKVIKALEQEYAAWNRVKKWIKREQPDLSPGYLIKVEKQTVSRWLGFTEDGWLFRAVREKTTKEDLAPEMSAFMESRYDWVWILECGKREEEKIYIDILEDNRLKTVVFNQSFSWEYTSWPVSIKLLPERVKQVFRENSPAGAVIEWAEYHERVSGNFYYLVGALEDGSQQVLCIATEGHVIPVDL